MNAVRQEQLEVLDQKPAQAGSPTGAKPPRLLTVAEVAVLIGKSEAWVYRQSRAGAIPTILIGRSRRFSPTAIEEWLDGNQVRPY